MHTVKFVYWEEDGAWIGYLQDYPDSWTQGESLDDLKDHLRALYHDLTSGELPGIRKVENWSCHEAGRSDQSHRGVRLCVGTA